MATSKTKLTKQPKRIVENKHTLSRQLRDVIESRELTAYAVGKEAGVDPTVVGRFLSGERDLRLATAERIALALGLRLVEVARPKVVGRSLPRRAGG